MNALTPEMLVRLDQAWAQISKDPEIRVVILTGAGERAFCVGAEESSGRSLGEGFAA
jgi:enoyl-CoA hydratase/carnithine racemase